LSHAQAGTTNKEYRSAQNFPGHNLSFIATVKPSMVIVEPLRWAF
jgi:hypothetical protein